MMRTFPSLLPLLLAAACNPWADLPSQSDYFLDAETWDDALVAASDGLYISLPNAGDLIRVQTNGKFAPVDLDGARPLSSYLSQAGDLVLTFAEWPICFDDDPDIVTVSDCPDEKLEWGSELELIADGKVSTSAEVPTFFNRMAFSPEASGRNPLAVAYLDYDGSDIPVDGVLNLGDVLFIDLAAGRIETVHIGFSPNRVLFSQDGEKVVVLSRNQARVLDATTFERIVNYNLANDVRQEIDPTDAVITPDGRNLLISVEGRQEIYSLDLEVESINLISLGTTPTAMATDSATERAVVVYRGAARADILIRQPNYYNDFEVDSVTLYEACTEIAETNEGFVVLYNTSSATHDVYRIDLDTTERVVYRVANPLTSLVLTPDHAFAVGIGMPEYYTGASGLDAYYDDNWTFSLMNLAPGRSDVIDLVLESAPVGMAFTGGDGAPVFALLLLADQEYLLMVNVQTGAAEKVTLPEPPTGIGSMTDPTYDFYITHASPLGLVSFLDSSDPDKLVQVSGFAVSGILGRDELPRTGK